MEVSLSTIIGGLLILVNCTAFAIMGYDKHLAVRGKRAIRLSEGLLFFLATAFGSIGVFFGMHVFRHKTRTWYFQIGIPMLIAQNLAVAYLIVSVFSQ